MVSYDGSGSNTTKEIDSYINAVLAVEDEITEELYNEYNLTLRRIWKTVVAIIK